MSYANEHASALADVRAAGAAVAFSLETAGTHNEAAGTFTAPSTSTVSGFAIRKKGSGKRYEQLGLVESESPTLLFVPSTFGETPALGAKCTWGGVGFIVKDVDPVAPDGTAIMFNVIVSR